MSPARSQLRAAEPSLWEVRALALQLLASGAPFNECQRRFLFQVACRFRRLTPYRCRVLQHLAAEVKA